MRVLQVIHDFLPRHQAGAELYCFHLSQALQRLGLDVHLLFGEIDHHRRTGDTRRGEYEGLPFLEIVQNHDTTTVRHTYDDPRIRPIVQAELERLRPDIVHIHHLLGLGFPLPAMAKSYGAKVIMTLHDYWLSCARGGGQRYRGPGKLCVDVDPGLCAQCLAGQHAGGSRLVRRLAGWIKRKSADDSWDLVEQLPSARIETPNAAFVSQTTLTVDGITRRAILAHPPSRIHFKLKVPTGATFESWVAVEPSVHDRLEAGVIFQVLINHEPQLSIHLHPRELPADRTWHPVQFDLSPWSGTTLDLQLRTSVPAGAGHDYATAGWGLPRIEAPENHGYDRYQPSKWAKIREWGENGLGYVLHQPYRREAQQRMAESHRVAKAVDVFLAPSHYLAERFRAYGFPPEKILFSDYGIWTQAMPPRPAVGTAPNRPLRFVFVGTLVEHKGAHVLIEAFRDLPHERATLSIYGNPDEFVDYTARLRHLAGKGPIQFCGRLENRDIMRILAEADALIVPSIWFENSPITIHEAFLARIPVIASDLGGMAGLVEHGKNGFLFPVGDAGALRSLLQELIAHPQQLDFARPDPSSAKTMPRDGAWMKDLYVALCNGHPLPETIAS